jgi:rod shape-determining protein MreC
VQKSLKDSKSLIKRFSLLFVFVIFLIFLDVRFTVIQNIRLALSIITNPIYSLINLPTNIGKFVDDVVITKQDLQTINQKLSIENKLLKVNFQKYNTLLYEVGKLKKILAINTKFEDISFEFATVLKINQSRIKKQIIIDKGKTDNAFVGKMVIGEDGVIGYIKTVELFKSRVLLVSDPTYQVSVTNQRNGLKGILSGKAGFKHLLKLDFMPNDSDVMLGDIFVTRNVYKKHLNGFSVAKVIKINENNQYFMDIELEPVEKLQHLDTILLVNKK